MQTFQTWMAERFSRDELHEINSFNGARKVFSSLTYCGEMVSFYERFQEEIWDILCEGADEAGMDTGDFIAKQSGNYPVANPKALITVLVWIAAKEIAAFLLCKMEMNDPPY